MSVKLTKNLPPKLEASDVYSILESLYLDKLITVLKIIQKSKFYKAVYILCKVFLDCDTKYFKI